MSFISCTVAEVNRDSLTLPTRTFGGAAPARRAGLAPRDLAGELVLALTPLLHAELAVLHTLGS